MSHDKFLSFLESLTTEENKGLIEAITEGYIVCLETDVGKFLEGEREKAIASKIDRNIDALDNLLDRAGLTSVIEKHSELVAFVTENINLLDGENYNAINRAYSSMLKYIKSKFPVGGDILLDIEERVVSILDGLEKLVVA